MQQRIESHIGNMFDDVIEKREVQTIVTTAPPEPDPEEIPEINERPESASARERRLLLEEEARGRVLFADILEVNEDFLGMIEIPGLIPRQPYVRSRDNKDYLNTDFYGNRNRHGTVFLNATSCPLLTDNNNIFFGHYTTGGTMFTKLLQYKTADTYRRAPVIILDGLIGESVWIVFAAYVTEPTTWYTIPIYEIEDYADHLGEIRARSIFDTDVDVGPDDRIITLSVCDYTYEDMRFAVHARKLRPGEEIPESVKAEYNKNRKAYSIPNLRPIREVDLTNTATALNPVTQRFVMYQARAGAIDRYLGDTNNVQGPFRALTHPGITASSNIAAMMLNLREEDDEDARTAYIAVQGVGGGQGITLFTANLSRSSLVSIGVVTPAGVNAQFPAIQNSGGLWLLYGVPGDDQTNIYRQPITGGTSERLATVYGTTNARPIGVYNVDGRPVVVWYEPSSGYLNGARTGVNEVFPVRHLGAGLRVSAYGIPSGTTVRIAFETGGRLSFGSFDLSAAPTGDPPETAAPPEPAESTEPAEPDEPAETTDPAETTEPADTSESHNPP